MAKEQVMVEREDADEESRPFKPAVPPPDNPLWRQSDFMRGHLDRADAARKHAEAWRQSRDMPVAED